MKLNFVIVAVAILLMTGNAFAASVYWDNIVPYAVHYPTEDDHNWRAYFVAEDDGHHSLMPSGVSVVASIVFNEDYSSVTIAGDLNGTAEGNEMKRYFFSVVSEGGDTKAVGYIDMAWGYQSYTFGSSYISIGQDAALPESIPEPSSGALVLFGLVLLALKRNWI